jgi:hypothetical protein
MSSSNRQRAGQFLHGRCYAWGVSGTIVRDFLALLDLTEPGWADQVEVWRTRRELWQDFVDYASGRGTGSGAGRNRPARFILAGTEL